MDVVRGRLEATATCAEGRTSEEQLRTAAANERFTGYGTAVKGMLRQDNTLNSLCKPRSL